MSTLVQRTPATEPEPAPDLAGPQRPPRRRRTAPEGESRTITSAFERRRPATRAARVVLNGGLLVFLLIVCLGPILWLAKSAITPTQDTLRDPLALWPNGVDWTNLRTAWVEIDLRLYFWNTVVIALGSWATQMVVAVTGGYVLSILRPRGSRVLYGLVLSTMFVPAVVLLVPLYLTVLDLPFTHWNLVNTFWGAFLPAGASAFNVALVKRFFDNLPRELIDAARVDGCGDFRLFFGIVLPMSRPVLGVVSVFAVLAAWKDFVWPLVVLPDPAKQPLSVRLPRLAAVTELDVVLAALLISCALPIAFFLVFQRLFLRGGLEGAVKG
ncbi:carbohydrate ABC transporter permease [Nocardioides sp. YIM 152315]|uniref:carbohydrate ABC transporter permease n=1 Tax=Nocardioides sp. YIM 152315 TaxID=3031760 RepID=UPI0023DA36F3|nr:carbohydrate ABC transporter permease [Nocardioides sp. YIM 152315]MDF1602409.1 carbohydrate ABC transporter permease [Nocardioides sp. YIM 152315]